MISTDIGKSIFLNSSANSLITVKNGFPYVFTCLGFEVTPLIFQFSSPYLISSILKGVNKKDLILDIFLGSGTTMIAAHQLDRVCYGMELDPKYCQVIIDRMLNLDKNIQIKINGKKYDRY